METTDSFQIAVIGAGVIGLAVAEELAALFRNVLIVEKNTGFGQETSSRNSEVIHAGIVTTQVGTKSRDLKRMSCLSSYKMLQVIFG